MQKIAIYQIYYNAKQLVELDAAFLPYDNTKNPNREWAEYHIFETEFSKGTHLRNDLTGYVSWKFTNKTRIAGSNFADFIQSNPGADVYSINPFPTEELLFRNVWYQGDFYHPGIMAFAQKILNRAGHSIDLARWQQQSSDFAFCNYWAGNAKFWQGYMDFTRPVAQLLRTGLDAEEQLLLHSIASQQNNFSYVAFFMERMFSTFLYLNPQYRWERYRYSGAQLRDRFGGLNYQLYKILRSESVFALPLKPPIRAAMLIRRHLAPK